MAGSQILARALLRVPSPVSVFVPNSPLIEWAFTQQALHSVARLWVSIGLTRQLNYTGKC